MSLKLKLIRKQVLSESNAQSQVEKASWIEILRRLREALEQTFRFLSRCIDDDAENILVSEGEASQSESSKWKGVREKYVQLTRNCVSLLSDLNQDTISCQVVDDLQAVMNFFSRTKVSSSPSKTSTVEPNAGSSMQYSQKQTNWKTNYEDKLMGSTFTAANLTMPDGPCSISSVTTVPACKSSVSNKSRLNQTKSNEKRDPVKGDGTGGSTAKDDGCCKAQTVSARQKSDCTMTSSIHCSDANTVSSGVQYPQHDGPLLIFDCQGNPLTDHNGVPLINVNRKLVIKYKDDKPISHSNGEPIFDEFGLPFVASLDKPLRGPDGKPLRLFNQENIPLTDGNGMVLKLSNGNYSLVLDEYNRILGDSFGSPIFDDKGKMMSGNLESRNKKLSNCFGAQGDGTCIMLYNEKGFLLTDKYGKPLTTAAGQPLIQLGPNGEVTDMFGGPVHDENGKLYGSKPRVPYLRVYDCDKYPLTNGKGEVLYDAGGKPLLVFNPSGLPISDSENRVIYDSNNIPCNDPHFQPHSEKVAKPRKAIFDFEIQIYNSRGRPMLDFDGSSLCNADGNPVIVTRDGKPYNDIEGNPLFDEVGIPISQVNGTWICPQGEPYRVFDCQGRPLTDKKGKDLYSINDQCLLKLDKVGRPVFTYMKGHVCDSNGVPVFDPLFDPSLSPPNDELRMQVFVGDTPLQVFDRFGKPLSDCDGMALVDSQGRCLIQFNEAGVPIGDIAGATIYDENRLPLGCSQSAAIISMNGLPFRLFDVHKRPLTDKNGYPLSLANDKPLLKFDGVGRPVSDIVGSPILDFRGRNVVTDPEARADSVLPEVDHVVKDTQSNPLQLFDSSGWPLTDQSGVVLVKADGTHLRLNHQGEPVADSLGGPLFDQYGTPLEEVLSASQNSPRDSAELDFDRAEDKDAFGRPLKDAMGTDQFDQYGRPVFDLYRRNVFDQSGRPLSDAFGRRIADGTSEPTFKLPFDVRILSSAVKRSCLKKFNTGLHKDLLGGPLFDCDGIPLFNDHGKPIVDKYGRDLYDSQGYLQCDTNGKPLSKQVKVYLKGRTIVDVKDVVKMIQVPKEMIPMMSPSLVVGKRVGDSLILPGSCIKGSRYKQHPRGSRTYWALLRVTEVSDGTHIYELLKALELDEVFDNRTSRKQSGEGEGSSYEMNTPDSPSVVVMDSES